MQSIVVGGRIRTTMSPPWTRVDSTCQGVVQDRATHALKLASEEKYLGGEGRVGRGASETRLARSDMVIVI
jgi:hypothetical protein